MFILPHRRYFSRSVSSRSQSFRKVVWQLPLGEREIFCNHRKEGAAIVAKSVTKKVRGYFSLSIIKHLSIYKCHHQVRNNSMFSSMQLLSQHNLKRKPFCAPKYVLFAGLAGRTKGLCRAYLLTRCCSSVLRQIDQWLLFNELEHE